MSDLPLGWIGTRFETVADIQLGKMLDKAKNSGNPTPYLRNINVRWGEVDTSNILTMPMSAEERSKFSIRDGDVLVCEGGEPGRSAVWRLGPTDFKFQKALLRVRAAEGVCPDWLAFHLRLAARDGTLSERFSGTTIKHLPREALQNTPLLLPPTDEQRRIVAKIDSLSAKSKRARDRLDHVPRLVARFKDALLDAAATAELTQAWRETLAIQAPEVGCLSDLIATPIRNGLSVRGSDEPPGIRSLRLSALRTQRVDIEDVRYLSISRKEASKYELSVGDILVSRGNGNKALVGIASVVPNLREPTIFPDTAFRLRLKTDTSVEWLAYIWNSPLVRRQIEATAKTTAGIWKISQADLATVVFPVPCFDEQREIVHRIETAFAWINRLASEATSARALIDRLDQAVLAKAFRGELVAQDPADVPASVLLKRIKMARDETEPAGKRRGRSRKAALL